MRVLLATDSFPPNCGGSGWSTWELTRGLRSRGHDVTVVQPRPGTPSGLRQRAYQGVEVLELGAPAPSLPYLRNYFKNERLTRTLTRVLARAIEDCAIDIVHAQHVLTGPAAIAAAHARRRPAVCTVRDYWPVCYWSDLIVDPDQIALCPACSVAMMTRCIRPRAGSAWPMALPMIPYMRANLARKRHALAKADAVIAVSSTIAADLRERAPELGATRLETIPNPVGLDDVRQAALRPAPLEPPYVVYVGKIALNKGTRWLVDVARAADLAWPLVVVGDGPDRLRLEREAAASGRDIRLVGWRDRDEALTWLAHATAVIFPSHGPESLSRVLMEAGALARPIAAMNTGGTCDIIVHERTGLLSATPDGLARDLARLVHDPALRSRLGEGARQHVASTFDAHAVVGRIEQLYADLVSRGVEA